MHNQIKFGDKQGLGNNSFKAMMILNQRYRFTVFISEHIPNQQGGERKNKKKTLKPKVICNSQLWF